MWDKIFLTPQSSVQQFVPGLKLVYPNIKYSLQNRIQMKQT